MAVKKSWSIRIEFALLALLMALPVIDAVWRAVAP